MIRYDVRTGVRKIKTRTALAISVLGLGAAGTFGSLAILGSAHADTGMWQLKAGSHIIFSCLGNGSLFPHTLNTVIESNTGNLTGTGTYDVDTSYTWDMTGNISGDNISMLIHYTGQQAGAEYNLAGSIASDGSVSGTTDSNCQSFTMPAGSAVHQSNSTVVVSPSNMNGWYAYDDQNDSTVTATGKLVTGPATPPLGVGSAQLSVTGSSDGQAFATNSYLGPLLAVSRIWTTGHINQQPHRP